MKRTFVLSEEEREDIADRVVRKLKGTTYVNTKTAAKILGISASRVYQIKERLGYVKIGNSKQSGIRFPIENLHNVL